jgi:F0F1-type ATP synthase assembly protein I
VQSASTYNYKYPMTPARIACALAVLAVVCVLALFFFPGIEGPYSAVHGPVTALLSIRAAALLRVRIVRAGLSAVCGCLRSGYTALLPLSWAGLFAMTFRSSRLSEACCSILRC